MTMQSIEPLHTGKRASRLVEISTPSAFLELMTAGKHPATLMDTYLPSPSDLWHVAVVSQWHHRCTCYCDITDALCDLLDVKSS